MEIFLECLPCILRQALQASRMSTDNIALQTIIMDEAISILSQYKSFRNSPEVAREIHRIVKEQTGNVDPYCQIKRKDLQMALSLYPKLKLFVESKEDRLYWALKAGAIGNMLDSALGFGYDIEGSMDDELGKPFAVCDVSIMKQRLKTAKSLLVIGDNVGETVFDCLLLQQLPSLELTYAVRSAPIINDATIEDAQASGLGQYARIVTTGCGAPGVLLNECSEAFLDIFYNADIVISKGQGNYETLSDCDRELFFLLKAKCPVIAELLGVGLNEFVFKFIECEKAKE
ncbi:MAG TPA: ARMT1-like domain-containing protein [Bacilli bacterium]|nr:ARMT1-like domain-containing protein [Bacilli bacterium]